MRIATNGSEARNIGNTYPPPNEDTPGTAKVIRCPSGNAASSNWVATGSARWDLVANQINQYVVGAGYVDDCFVLAANYVTSYSYATAASPPILGYAIMFQGPSAPRHSLRMFLNREPWLFEILICNSLGWCVSRSPSARRLRRRTLP
jgi:hypothetical protein